MYEEENAVFKSEYKNMFVPVCVTQAVCMAVILIAVFVIKTFFAGSYQKAEKWYAENILDETNVSELFDGETGNEI